MQKESSSILRSLARLALDAIPLLGVQARPFNGIAGRQSSYFICAAGCDAPVFESARRGDWQGNALQVVEGSTSSPATERLSISGHVSESGIGRCVKGEFTQFGGIYPMFRASNSQVLHCRHGANANDEARKSKWRTNGEEAIQDRESTSRNGLAFHFGKGDFAADAGFGTAARARQKVGPARLKGPSVLLANTRDAVAVAIRRPGPAALLAWKCPTSGPAAKPSAPLSMAFGENIDQEPEATSADQETDSFPDWLNGNPSETQFQL